MISQSFSPHFLDPASHVLTRNLSAKACGCTQSSVLSALRSVGHLVPASVLSRSHKLCTPRGVQHMSTRSLLAGRGASCHFNRGVHSHPVVTRASLPCFVGALASGGLRAVGASRAVTCPVKACSLRSGQGLHTVKQVGPGAVRSAGAIESFRAVTCPFKACSLRGGQGLHTVRQVGPGVPAGAFRQSFVPGRFSATPGSAVYSRGCSVSPHLHGVACSPAHQGPRPA